MTDLTFSKMGSMADLGLLMLDWVMMDTRYLGMMSRIRHAIIRTHGMWAQGIVQLSELSDELSAEVELGGIEKEWNFSCIVRIVECAMLRTPDTVEILS